MVAANDRVALKGEPPADDRQHLDYQHKGTIQDAAPGFGRIDCWWVLFDGRDEAQLMRGDEIIPSS